MQEMCKCLAMKNPSSEKRLKTMRSAPWEACRHNAASCLRAESLSLSDASFCIQVHMRRTQRKFQLSHVQHITTLSSDDVIVSSLIPRLSHSSHVRELGNEAT